MRAGSPPHIRTDSHRRRLKGYRSTLFDIDAQEIESAAPPLDMLAHYFEAHGWAFERAGDEEIVAKVEGSWTTYQLRALWREDERVLQFIAFPDIRVPEGKRTRLYETLASSTSSSGSVISNSGRGTALSSSVTASSLTRGRANPA